MRKLLVTTALAVFMISPALAGEKTKSITIVCSDDVEKGVIVLSDPPKMSCEDYDSAIGFVGSGFSIGPNSTVEKLKTFLIEFNKKQKRKMAREVRAEQTRKDDIRIGRFENEVPVVKAPTTPIKVRPEEFSEQTKPIPEPTFRTYDQKDYDARDRALQSLYRSDERSSWKTISADEYENFDGFSRNKKFFRD
jgi:hypothetical protein